MSRRILPAVEIAIRRVDRRSMATATATYLLCLSGSHPQFREPEIRSVISLLRLNISWKPPAEGEMFPQLVLADEADARKLTQRTVAVKWCMELWGVADRIPDLHEELQTRLLQRPESIMRHMSAKTFCMDVETRGKTLQRSEKLELIDAFSYLHPSGRVRLKEPELRLRIVLDYGVDTGSAPQDPQRVYFGRWVSDGPRSVITRHSLKTRPYIGNTSMEPELALIMANLARVQPGDLAWDPFCGTGSILVAAAHWGAHVVGTDIDYRTVHASTLPSRVIAYGKREERRDPRESIAANLAHYGLQSRLLDVLVADGTRPQLWRRQLSVDAIVTDPPYGIRERSRRLRGAAHGQPAGPRAADCCAGQLFAALLQLAADRLPVGGRLVFWLPVMRDEYTEATAPRHSCLRLVADCEQALTALSARRLLTMEKWRQPADGDRGSLLHDSLAQFKQRYFSSVHPQFSPGRSNLSIKENKEPKTDNISREYSGAPDESPEQGFPKVNSDAFEGSSGNT